jgi:putative PIN family toxin of toxin-antitoxin system
VRVVLDPNILISALLSPSGSPARVVSLWLAGEFELVVSESLLDELGRALAYPKLRARVSPSDAADLVALLRRDAIVASDPPDPPRRSPDVGDDYLLALAESQQALLVSGDEHLLQLADRFPIRSPLGLIEALEA